MGRLLGYMANRADRLRDALHQERRVLHVEPLEKPAGWGIGFYQGGEVLHRKRPLHEGVDFDWGQVARDVRSDCVVIHLRHATVGDFRAHNTHPFRMRSWLFAHHGTIEGFEAMRGQLLEALPDFIRRNIRGQTDSEHFFHVLLSFLHDAGQLERPETDDKAVLGALRSAVRLVDRMSKEVGAPAATLNLVLTNGERMYGLRRGEPMMLVERNGIQEPLDAEDAPLDGRYVLLISNGEVPRDYREVEEASVCVIDRNLEVSTYPL